MTEQPWTFRVIRQELRLGVCYAHHGVDRRYETPTSNPKRLERLVKKAGRLVEKWNAEERRADELARIYVRAEHVNPYGKCRWCGRVPAVSLGPCPTCGGPQSSSAKDGLVSPSGDQGC